MIAYAAPTAASNGLENAYHGSSSGWTVLWIFVAVAIGALLIAKLAR